MSFFLLFISFLNTYLFSQQLPRMTSEVLSACFLILILLKDEIIIILMLKFPHICSVGIASSWHPNSFDMIYNVVVLWYDNMFKVLIVYFVIQI